ncbi:MAG TPA: HAD family phosphatase [Cyclobacteriaceae bacterium]|nr:HAD family phosphatase [Cyclobacteriaceae bacterium]
MLKGVIFDMDGVIMDNNAYHEKAWIEFCKSYGISLTPEEIHHQIFGRIAKDTLEYIFKKNLRREEINFFVNQKENIYRDIYRKAIKPNPGLIGFLDDLKAHKLRLGLATSAPPGNVDYTLQHIPVRKYFEVILDAESVIKGKPDPEIYLKAIGMLGLVPEECIIFEDSIPGIRSGIAAGAHVIGVATTHKRDELKAVKWIVDDFRAINSEYLSRLIDRSQAV